MKETACTKQLVTHMKNHGHSAVMVTDSYMITCLADLEFPFAAHYPEKPLLLIVFSDGTPFLSTPFEWSGAVLDQGWGRDITAYSDAEADTAAFLGKFVLDSSKKMKFEGGTIGIDMETLPAHLQKEFEKSLPSVKFENAAPYLHEIRYIKNDEQTYRLKTAAEQLDFGIIAALQHLEGSLEDIGYTVSEFCERIRVHVYECGGTAGGLASAAAGDNSRRWYGIPKGKFVEGELIRLESTSCFRGYWANAARMITIGEAAELQARAYRENGVLKQTALHMLNPGTPCSSIYTAITAEASGRGIDLLKDFEAGHGIGTSEREAPFLAPGDDTALEEGMCIVLSIYTEGPQKELICSKDTYRITKEGPLCISDYHNWDSLYQVTGFRSAH